MKTRLLRVISGFCVVLPLVVTSCMMNETEDYPDFTEQLQKDLAIIDSYLASNNIMAQKDKDELIRYVLLRDAAGENKATLDSCVVADYRGIFLSNNQEFDKGTNFAFPVAGVIDGWKVGIPLLSEGDSAVFFIPSGLAYGFRGYQPEIPANANLIFHVAVKKVGKTYKTSDRSCN